MKGKEQKEVLAPKLKRAGTISLCINMPTFLKIEENWPKQHAG